MNLIGGYASGVEMRQQEVMINVVEKPVNIRSHHPAEAADRAA